MPEYREVGDPWENIGLLIISSYDITRQKGLQIILPTNACLRLFVFISARAINAAVDQTGYHHHMSYIALLLTASGGRQ